MILLTLKKGIPLLPVFLFSFVYSVFEEFQELPPYSLYACERACPDLAYLELFEEDMKKQEEQFFNVLNKIKEIIPTEKTCFISHASNPGRIDSEYGNFFKYYDVFYELLDKALDAAGIETYFDRREDPQHRGIGGYNDTDHFCKKVNDTDYVIAVLTPYYKSRYETPGSGVHKEYTEIINKSERVRHYRYYIPALLDGGFETSIPETNLKRAPYKNVSNPLGFYRNFFSILKKDIFFKNKYKIEDVETKFFDQMKARIKISRKINDIKMKIKELQEEQESSRLFTNFVAV